MKTPHSLPDEVLRLIAARFKALSEPLRLKLIMALETGEKNVTDLVEVTGTTQANTSRQLQILSEAGILRRRKQGANAFYCIADPAIFSLCEHVCGGLRKEHERKEAASRLLHFKAAPPARP